GSAGDALGGRARVHLGTGGRLCALAIFTGVIPVPAFPRAIRLRVGGREAARGDASSGLLHHVGGPETAVVIGGRLRVDADAIPPRPAALGDRVADEAPHDAALALLVLLHPEGGKAFDLDG